MEPQNDKLINLGERTNSHGGINYPDPTDNLDEELNKSNVQFILEGEPVPPHYQIVERLAGGVKVAEEIRNR